MERENRKDGAGIATEEREDHDDAGSTETEKGSPVSGREYRRILGRNPRTGELVTAPGSLDKHGLFLGRSGTGKSTFILTQMLQDVHRGDSVVLIDPHGGTKGLTHRFLSRIPEERHRDVIYINPLTAFSRTRLVKINFLQPRRLRSDLVREMFIDALKRTYPEFWGPRLENILTHALMLLYETVGVPTLEELSLVVPNRNGKRDELLGKCYVDEVTQFWGTDFRDMDPQSYTSVMNKIYKMMTASPMREFAKARDSTIDLYDEMNEGKIIVVEIPKGKMTENITAFFGSIFLARLAQLAMQREEIPEDERHPVRVYVDEAHTFVTDILQKNMQELRKFGVFFNASSQNLQRYSEKGNENILPELADYVVAFRCGEETARRIGQKFSSRLGGRYTKPWEPITNLDDYVYYAAVPAGSTTEVKKGRTIDPEMGPYDRGEIIDRSLKLYGEVTEAHRVGEGKGGVTIGQPHIKPPEFYVLNYLDRNRWDRRDNVVDKLNEFPGIPKRDVRGAIRRLTRRGYINSDTEHPLGRKEKAEGRNPFVWLAELGENALYPEIRGPRVGGPEHISMICQVMRKLREDGFLAAPVTPSDRSPSRHVAKITEVNASEGGAEVYPDLIVYYGRLPNAWSGSAKAAVEVDTRHEKKRYVEHYRDNRDHLMTPTLLVLKNEDEVEKAEKALEEEGAEIVGELGRKSGGDEVEIIVVDPYNVGRPSDVEDKLDPDKRLYRQVKASCRGKGYSEFIESSPGEETGEKPRSEIVRTVYRICETAGEASLEDLKEKIEKLKDMGCQVRFKDGEVVAEWEEGGREKSYPLEDTNGKLKKAMRGEIEEKTSAEEEKKERKPTTGEDKEKWENMSGEEKLEFVDRTVEKLKNQKEEGTSAQILSENLRDLKERSCTIRIAPRGDYEYLVVEKSISGDTMTRSLGAPDKKWRKACEIAGIGL